MQIWMTDGRFKHLTAPQRIDTTSILPGTVLSKLKNDKTRFERFKEMRRESNAKLGLDVSTPLMRVFFGHEFCEMIRASGMTREELIASFPTTVSVPEKDREVFANFEKLDNKTVDVLINLMSKVIDKIWLDDELLSSPRSVFLLYVSSRHFSEIKELADLDEKNASPALQHMSAVWKTPNFVAVLKTDYLPEVADYTGLSLHYLLRLENDIPFYSSKPHVDELYDLYTLLDERWKAIINKALSKYCNKENMS